MEAENALIKMFNNVWPHLGERERRLVAASEARRIGRCGISMVSRACGLSRVTITKGLRELDEAPLEPGKTRRPGAGRPRVERVDPGLWACLEELLEESTLNVPDPALLWTHKSTRQLSRELTGGRHPISHEKVAQILRQKGFRLQGTRMAESGAGSRKRLDQFICLNLRLQKWLEDEVPVIAVETRRQETAWLCQDRNSGDCARGQAALARDWPDQLSAGSFPAGIYDPHLARDCVNVETKYDNISFTVDSIIGWWNIEGRRIYSQSPCLAVIAEIQCPEKMAVWQKELQRLAEQTGVTVELARMPPGTTRWNKPSLRLFSYTSSHWQGHPIRDYETVARLLDHKEEVRTMAVGLRLDHSRYQTPAYDEAALARNFEDLWNLSFAPGGLDESGEDEFGLEYGEVTLAASRLARAI